METERGRDQDMGKGKIETMQTGNKNPVNIKKNPLEKRQIIKPRETNPPRAISAKGGERRSRTDTCVYE
jgi:hypothetical protein